jgi:hypothetical protein
MKTGSLIIIGIIFAVPAYMCGQLKSAAGVSPNNPNTSIEDTWGILDKGELINVCGNQGLISDSYYQSTMYDMRWPKSKGVANLPSSNAINDVSIMFGSKGNVIDGYSLYKNEDWQGILGGSGKYFADDQPASLKAPDGGPRMAHSDIPKTWPAGYFDSLNVFHLSPTGALDQLSAADRNVVLQRSAWYDEEKNLWRFWPGRFRIDTDSTSATYKQQLSGQFAADRELYTIFTDRNTQLPDKPLGVQVEMQAYCWGRRFAQDIQFYDFTITNKSNVRLDSCSWGYMLDYRFGDANEEGYTTYNTGVNAAGYDNALITWDWNGATSPDRGINNGYFGSAILATPNNLGVTDGHFFRGNSTYKPVKSKRTIWPVMISNPTDPVFAGITGGASNYFHGGANLKYDIFDSTYLVPTRWDFTQFAVIQSTGLFSLDPGKSVRACIAFTAGSTMDQFKRNIATAQRLILAEYNGPSVPPSPKLTGVAGDRRNTLYWSDSPEKVADIMTKKIDFEGYKIYRSQDQGATWGKQVIDGQGRLIGYVPIAQFDKVNDVQGTDPQNNFNFLGLNTGLRHMWVDTTVSNGIQYSYCVTSYDCGDPLLLESFESSRGTSSSDINLVDLTPRPDPAGYVSSRSTISKSSTNGKATVAVSVADPSKLQPQKYKILFNKTPADSFYFTGKNDSVLAKVPLTSDEMKVIDGVRVRIETDGAIGGIKKITDESNKIVSSSTSKNQTGYWYISQKSYYATAETSARTSDYEFRFTQFGSYADTAGTAGQGIFARIKVPFEVWNVSVPSAQRQINAVVEDINRNGQLNFGDVIRIVNIPYKTTVNLGDSLGLYTAVKIPYTIKIDTLARDSLLAPRLPLTGQSFKIETYSAITQKDTFTLEMVMPSLVTAGMTNEQLLSRVRVVPNPYIGTAKWEQVQNTRKMQFTFLPPVCTISIFTVRGELVNRLRHANQTGTEDWNLTNQSSVEVSFGMYIYVVETPDGGKITGKFAIIK